MPLIESIPNLSEGRRPGVIEVLTTAVRSVPGVRLLDVHVDPDHNRSVLTMVGDPGGLKTAVLALFETACQRIDMREHRGAHPRLGAVDVVPFIPIEDVSMAECVALARAVGREVALRLDLPVFLYEEAASAPHRRGLEDVRRGEFEGLTQKLNDPAWKPDFGPSSPHPSAGATAVGARMPLIAYNVNLGTADAEVAKRIAKAIRHSSGGHPCVKAIGVMLASRNLAQVSINLTDFKRTPLRTVFESVQREAARQGVAIVGSEIVGLVPEEALSAATTHFLRLEDFRPSQILERRLKEPM